MYKSLAFKVDSIVLQPPRSYLFTLSAGESSKIQEVGDYCGNLRLNYSFNGLPRVKLRYVLIISIKICTHIVYNPYNIMY